MKKIIISILLTLSLTVSADLLKGTISGFPKLPRDKMIDYVFHAPTLNPAHLAYFHFIYQVQGSLHDMKVAGRSLKVPSYLSFPKQKEKIAFISIKLNKPQFTTSILPYQKAFQSVHAQVSLKILREVAKTKDFLGVPFRSSFKKAKIQDNLTLSSYNIDYSKETIEFSSRYKVTENSSYEKHNLYYLALEKVESMDDEFFLTDMKQATKQNPTPSLTTVRDTKPYMISFITPKPGFITSLSNFLGFNDDYISPLALPENQSQSLHFITPEENQVIFLPHISKPVLSENTLSIPELPFSSSLAELIPTGMKAILWKVDSYYFSNHKVSEIRKLIGEVSLDDWKTNVDISRFQNLKPGEYSWQLVYQARYTNKKTPQFFSSNSVNFKIPAPK